jgi:hypothetical protein
VPAFDPDWRRYITTNGSPQRERRLTKATRVNRILWQGGQIPPVN